MASLQVIHVSDRGVESTRPIRLDGYRFTDYQGNRHHASRSPTEILEEQGRDIKHEIKLLKRRLSYSKHIEARRSFPNLAHQALIEAQSPLFTTNEDGEFSSRGLTDWYVSQYCKANHLKECAA